jgi:glycosyltransferase involved in cell wall biosynthesis
VETLLKTWGGQPAVSARGDVALRILVGMPEDGSRGGSPNCEPPFVRELLRLGVDVQEQTYTYADAAAGFLMRVVRVLRTAHRCRKELRSRRFDVLHLNTSFDKKALIRDFVTLCLIRPKRTKIFLKFHGSDARLLKNKNLAVRFIRKCLFASADGIGVLSSEERANFLRAGVSERKLFVVFNVVNRNTSRSNSRSSPPFETQVPQLLFIGRFIHEKGITDVIRACKLVRDRGVEFKLICLGDGPARADAEREVGRLNLGDCVEFTGHVHEEEVSEFYAAGTALVFPTYHCEGFPMTIFDAAAAGLPIITTRIRAAADHLQEPDNCLWTRPETPTMLAKKIIDLLRNSSLRRTMSDNNRRLAARFSRETVTRKYLEIYEAIVDGKEQAQIAAPLIAPPMSVELSIHE